MSSQLKISKPLAVLLSLLIYIVTIGIVFYAASFFKDYHILLKIGIADLLGTIIIFIFSMIFNNSSMYDPYWSVKPMVIAYFYFSLTPIGEMDPRHAIVLFAVALYAFRLTANFYQGWTGFGHEDWRYRNFREKFPKIYWLISFFGIHFFPTVMVYLGCLPMFVIFSQKIEFPTLFIVGGVIILISVLIAFIADQQLRSFRLDLSNKGKTIQSGFWSLSRHPNYFGEILTWWGLFIAALGYGLEYWWTGIGALTITLMFFFISIPMMEKHSIAGRPDYSEYQNKTPRLFPKIF